MRYNTFFVDTDDTLFDFQKSSVVAFKNCLAELGIELPWEDVFSTFKKTSAELWRDFEQGKVDRMTLRYDRFTRTFKSHGILKDAKGASHVYLENLCNNVFFIEGAIELIEEIRKRGYTTGILTNGVSYVQKRRLENSKLKDLIDFMVVSEDCEGPKPHPSMFLKAFALSRTRDKREIIMLGDSLTSDIQGAFSFGIDSCWYNPLDLLHQDVKPTYQIKQIQEFKKFF